MQRVMRGDRVQILCASRLADGTWLDDEVDRARPLWLRAGARVSLQPIADAVIGMAVGEKKTLTIPPERGFGYPEDERICRVKMTLLPADVLVGDRLVVELGTAKLAALVLAIEDCHAVVDTNHPLAGQTLTVELQLVAVSRCGIPQAGERS